MKLSHTTASASPFIGLQLGGLNYSLALQRLTGQTVLLQALTLSHMTSNDHSTTKIFVDNCLLSMLSIMSTNCFSPILNKNYKNVKKFVLSKLARLTQAIYFFSLTR